MTKTHKIKIVYSAFLFLLAFSYCMFSCSNDAKYKKNQAHNNVDDLSIQKGELLAKRYCQSCHLLPDPLLLSSDKWGTGVLPEMGPYLGIFGYGFNLYPTKRNDPNVGIAFYPNKPIISYVEWQNIIDYYTSLSPDTLIPSKRDCPIITNDQLFIPQSIDKSFQYSKPVVGCIYIDTTIKSSSLLIADINKGTLTATSENTKLVDSLITKSAVVSIAVLHDTLLTANIGILYPNDGQTGSIQQVRYTAGRFTTLPVVLDSGLRRPVHIDVFDINGDGLKDILVCEYGNLKGALSWLENKGDNHYERHVIRNVPGAIATVVKDFNHDGLPDFYVLFAQGDEQIIRFENKGDGKFEAKTLLRFPPMYGSSYFEMVDMNKDGIDDIVYTCGDNADYSIELKPYHGVYIFINDGHDHFKQQYFFHINGCFKAMATDFDKDGDQDIAAISFFADYKHRPEEGFVYLENKGGFHFSPYSVSAAKDGRWISMDIGDVDKDGKPDIVLGNFSFKTFIPSSVDWKHKPAFLLLKNNTF